MEVRLLNWSNGLKQDLIYICNNVDRSYLSDRLPSPYTEADADWWLGMVSENDGTAGMFRAIAVDGRVVGSISIECKADVYRRDGEIGYMLLTDYWAQGIMTVRDASPSRSSFLSPIFSSTIRTVLSPTRGNFPKR